MLIVAGPNQRKKRRSDEVTIGSCIKVPIGQTDKCSVTAKLMWRLYDSSEHEAVYNVSVLSNASLLNHPVKRIVLLNLGGSVGVVRRRKFADPLLLFSMLLKEQMIAILPVTVNGIIVFRRSNNT